MRIYKKILALTLILTSVFLLVSCKDTEVEKLEVSGSFKTNYLINEEFDSTGMIVKYIKGSNEEIITDYEITGFDSKSAGQNTITITYNELSTTVNLNITTGVQTKTDLKIYDMPDILKSSDRYNVLVEDSPLFVYETLVNHERSFTWVAPTTYTSVATFDFLGKVKVKIEIKDDYVVQKATVHPLSYEIETTIKNNTIEFNLEYPANYSIQINDPVPQDKPNGSVIQEVIHLFANPLETDPITKEMAENDEDILYIGPGVWKTDSIPLRSGMTVYIAGGALLYGQFNMYELENITIRGRGVISGSIYSRADASERKIPLEMQKSNNISIEGISFLDPAGWTIHIQESTNITIDNIKIITARANGDGISVQSSEDVDVRNSFIRTWDDSLVVKNVNNKPTQNVLFKNNILWTDLAQSMEVGYESYGAFIKNIVFEDITVLHNYHKATMSIHNADQAHVQDIYFRNITVEDSSQVGDIWTEDYDNFFIDLTITFNKDWSKSEYERGIISDVYFENIKVLNEIKVGRDDYDLRIRMNGFDQTKNIYNINFKDVTFQGEPIKDLSQINSNNFVEGINILSSNEPTGAPIYKYYDLELGDDYIVDKVVVPANVQEAILIPEFAVSKAEPPYAGTKIEGSFTARATYGNTTSDWGGSEPNNYEEDGFEVANVLIDDETYWKSLEWKEDAKRGDYIALSIELDKVSKVGSIRLYGISDSMYFLYQNISIYASTNRHSVTNLPIFSKKLNGENYEFSPSKNNYVDIRIQPGDYIAIQLRFYYFDNVVYANNPFLRYVELFPASLTYGKTPYANAFEDVYNPEKLTDGDVTTYFESKKNIWPGWIAIDMGQVYNVRIINLHLPPLSSWPGRTQTIEIKYATTSENNIDSPNWISLFEGPRDYYFDVINGNMVSISLPTGIDMKSIIFIVTYNSAPGGYGAQFSEISIYE